MKKITLFSHQMKCHGVRPPECSIASGAADNPYTWYTCWKCAVTRPIRSPFAPLTLQPCFLQIVQNSTLVHSCDLPLSQAACTSLLEVFG